MPVPGYSAVTIPIETYEILKKLSSETGRSMGAIVSEAILNIVEPKKPSQPESEKEEDEEGTIGSML